MLLTEKTHRIIFLLGLAISLCALPVSVFALSVGIITVVVNWIFDGNWKTKSKRFIENKALWAFLLVYFSMVIGSFYSENIDYTIKELKLWLPILILPVFITTSRPLSRDEFKHLLLLFCASVFIASLISTSIYISNYQTIGQNVREISPFIHHIRLALMVNLSIFILLFFTYKKEYFNNKFLKGLFLLVAAWLIVFLFILQSITGLVVLTIIWAILLLRWMFVLKNIALKLSLLIGLVLVASAIIVYLVYSVDRYFTRTKVDFRNLPEYTVNGNRYLQDTLKKEYENGNLIWINVCLPELKRSWEKVSKLSFNGFDRDSQLVELSLIRYMTSKGLTKDSVGFAKLDSVDIRLVENSVTSVIFREHRGGVYPRLYQTLWEIDSYINQGKIGGSSVVQRLIFLKASWAIIKNHFLFGVGTGDGKDTMLNYYKTSKVNLEKKYWFLSHNQFLTVWIASGLIGLALFLFGLLYPFFYGNRGRFFLCFVFQLIIFFSMLGEDTFETHAGISFAALFYSIFYFGYNYKEEELECRESV